MTFRAAAVVLLLFAHAPAASATPFSLSALLTGDPRAENPDDLRVLVSILGDTTSNVTYWSVDLDMGTSHPYARLNEFGFNVLGTWSQYSFSHFNLPYTPTTGTLDGSGGTTFMLTLDDPNGNRNDATNITNLSFRLTNSAGNFTIDHFLLAPVSCSSDSLLGCSQLGSHLQGLGSNAQDSGVANGDYTPPSAQVPEPGTLLLMATGLVAAAVGRHRIGRKNAPTPA